MSAPSAHGTEIACSRVAEEPMLKPFSVKKSFLLEPTYGYTTNGSTPHHPTIREALTEWLDIVDFVRKPRRGLNALLFVAHWSTLACLIAFLIKYLTLGTALFWLASVLFLCNGPHTLWYHRYCSHRAFKFKRPAFARIFLWLNPLYTPEEHYAIAHRQHHAFQERVGDPYGPHIGWLGSYVAIDSIQKLNVDISPERYAQLQKSVQHIGFKMSTYQQFRRTGTVEHLGHYFARTLVAQSFWCSLAYLIGGVPYVVTWYGATFMLWFLLRDFGWRGHRGKEKVLNWEFDASSSATNQRFYGYLASEWHDNHHLYPNSANLAFLPGQFDTSFQLVRLLNALGLLESYNDAKPKFDERFGRSITSRDRSMQPRAE
jgi:stearoyl-CoA desaturase (delta-9 desaturase)